MLLRRAQVHGLAELTMVAEEPGPAQPPPRWGPSLPFHMGRAGPPPGPPRFRVSFSSGSQPSTYGTTRTFRLSTHA